jgi:hypothetical protein
MLGLAQARSTQPTGFSPPTLSNQRVVRSHEFLEPNTKLGELLGRELGNRLFNFFNGSHATPME